MFDVGFWELFFIGLIALLVVGPDRLPALATHAGRWIARIRLKVRRIKAQIQNELETEHLKSLVDEHGDELDSLRREVREAKQEIDHAARTERYGGLAGPKSHPEDMVQSSGDDDAGTEQVSSGQEEHPDADEDDPSTQTDR